MLEWKQRVEIRRFIEPRVELQFSSNKSLEEYDAGVGFALLVDLKIDVEGTSLSDWGL